MSAVLDDRADAYASVAMAHRGYLKATPNDALEVVNFGASGGAAALGAYSFAKSNQALRRAFDDALGRYLGSPDHRAIMRPYGFADGDTSRIL